MELIVLYAANIANTKEIATGFSLGFAGAKVLNVFTTNSQGEAWVSKTEAHKVRVESRIGKNRINCFVCSRYRKY